MKHLAFTWIVEYMRLGLCGEFCGIGLKFGIYWCTTRHLNLVTRLGNRWLPGKRLCKNGSHVLRQEHSGFGGLVKEKWAIIGEETTDIKDHAVLPQTRDNREACCYQSISDVECKQEEN